MKTKWTLIFILIFEISFSGCTRKSFGITEDSPAIRISRFDTAMYAWIDTDDPARLAEMKATYPEMTVLLGKALFRDADAASPEYDESLINYFSEPTLRALYRDATVFYSPDSARTLRIAQELAAGFTGLQALLPRMKIPAVCFHVSGLQQNFIVTDSLVSCSIDKYLGADYRLYRDFFYDFQLKNMTPERIVHDFLTVWLKSEYIFQGKDNMLLDRMIYEGKILYILSTLYKNHSYAEIMNLTDSEAVWLKNSEAALWAAVIERKHLYTPDIVTVDKYFLPSPATFLSDEAPGNIGSFIGFRIVASYMKHTKSSCEELIANSDSQDILRKARYKP